MICKQKMTLIDYQYFCWINPEVRMECRKEIYKDSENNHYYFYSSKSL